MFIKIFFKRSENVPSEKMFLKVKIYQVVQFYYGTVLFPRAIFRQSKVIY